MRNLYGFLLAHMIMLGLVAEATAQVDYVGSGPTDPRPGYFGPVAGPGSYVHAYKNEPVMGVNNSYLGYSNFVNLRQPTPRFITGRRPSEAPVYLPASPQRGGGLFGWRRRNRQ